ncbi:hypothetical protein DENSPDRAFT_843628 [Dentipellis sp. KUC8613]|nr:hypothetical protein DENSPDRAFT_843628 [Dentipellis sp. KUC8613]
MPSPPPLYHLSHVPPSDPVPRVPPALYHAHPRHPAHAVPLARALAPAVPPSLALLAAPPSLPLTTPRAHYSAASRAPLRTMPRSYAPLTAMKHEFGKVTCTRKQCDYQKRHRDITTACRSIWSLGVQTE